MAILCFVPCTRCRRRLREKYRNLKSKVKRSNWIPSHWQVPDALETRAEHQKLSDLSIDRSGNPDSLFLRMLPLEIRLRIYGIVFSDPALLLEHQDTAPSEGESLKAINHHPINCLWRIPGRLVAKSPYPDRCDYAPHRLALLKSSRQIYTEAIRLFYTHPTFVIQDIPVLFDLANTILPQRLASVRHLHLQFLLRWPAISIWWELPKSTPDNAWMWARVWEVVGAQMTGLKELSVYIRQFMWSEEPQAKTERMVLEPLARRVRGLEAFRLWYRHEQVHDPFGDGYVPAYTYDVLGKECKEEEARLFREEVGGVVRKPRGWRMEDD